MLELLLYYYYYYEFETRSFYTAQIGHDPLILFFNFLNARIMGVHYHDWKEVELIPESAQAVLVVHLDFERKREQ